MAFPHTPKRGKDLYQLIDKLNEHFDLDIPNPQLHSPSLEPNRKSLRWRVHLGIKRLHYDRNVNLNETLNNFEEWVASRPVWANGSFPSNTRLKRDPCTYGCYANVPESERGERLRYLAKLIRDELYILTKGSYSPFLEGLDGITEEVTEQSSPSKGLKRRMSEEEDEFHTAPNSPVNNPEFGPTVGYTHDEEGCNLDAGPAQVFKSPKVNDTRGPSAFFQRLTAPDQFRRYDAVTPAHDDPNVSFATTEPTSIFDARDNQLDTSFISTITDATEPMCDSVYEDSVVNHMLSQELKTALERSQPMGESVVNEPPESVEQRLIDDLLHCGPFAQAYSFPGSLPLRYRYELERIGRAWNIPFDRMLAGNSIPFKTRDDFWEWIKDHNQRNGKPLPEKPTTNAWDFAIGSFETDKHSEVVVLTGDLEWCSEHEPGIFKLNLKPLKTERTCRFHRRFGSDRFLSLTMPAPSRPPRHFPLPSDPSLLRESIALWLTQNVHRCLGRTWKPFFVEEVKSKRKVKAEPKFRVDFFAIDGVDFDKSPHAPPIPPANQNSENHTPMSLDSLLDWHMSRDENIKQKNCKLFQRISLGLSKTFATITLKPSQVLHLADPPNPPVMNDGCALMSRGLANRICDSLGITGTTPSAFQGRIAGAKGLWMVDKHDSNISTGSNVWIQISDSQLKIEPHPAGWQEPVDEAKLTFEVVKWSKPLHTVDLNTQLLAILEHGGHIREYVADLTRAGIRAVYEDFATVVQSDSPVLCRSLIQKIRPPAESSNIAMLHKVRRLDEWTADDAEAVIRLTEAGFGPRTFHYLRKRLRRCLIDLLDQYVDQLHIEVPLSTYAFCIADPYGVLKEDEVHFGFSTNWRDPEGEFEDTLLDGMDVLVARLPAHLPSDIQRRRAVWKPELRHFKDVIVFPTVGTTPLAHMLSGGDYDGDMPWVCWDQNIVQKFRNSDLSIMDYPAEHFGLETHNVPMENIDSWDEFLQSTFTFNLIVSNLGRCTVEHEKISYDESIDSPNAKEVACLLSHLVDGRKGGVRLSEDAWRAYRKRVSPRARNLPAYKNPSRRPKLTNIIDYLRFEVAQKEKDSVLRLLEEPLSKAGTTYEHDRDLTRPWDEAQTQAEKDRLEGGQLHVILKNVAQEIDDLFHRWIRSVTGENSFSDVSLEIADQAKAVLPPEGDHPMILVWRYSEAAWLQLLASYSYKKHPESSFVLHAFGETICELKASSVPSRSVVNEILACYRVNQKVVARLTAGDMVEDEDSDGGDEYEGADAIAMLQATQLSEGYYDCDDDLFVE
ncbi:RNA dependent RNA polymerase-domain-containing protein [Aspergillus caelatus]|uniref:RNA-dependent RNA polymerase n=1 Tax=Aspergillus caelatus TaxID=61420 RepID=A0A5N6ZR21_9EURO|nr:RNA dependent RNA polymerase-domain-containing protein [Aspergillus caelatus]KAE8359838.1 RNA dependent RNA polymerase-domain-containing protein [Aspergillus caelatus]